MSDTTASSQEKQPSVRVVGVPTDPADHPALRKIARAVLSIAARHIADENDEPTDDVEDSHD